MMDSTLYSVGKRDLTMLRSANGLIYTKPNVTSKAFCALTSSILCQAT